MIPYDEELKLKTSSSNLVMVANLTKMLMLSSIIPFFGPTHIYCFYKVILLMTKQVVKFKDHAGKTSSTLGCVV